MKAKIKSMDSGLDTEVVEGSEFSHGERQLLCLARALLNKRASVSLPMKQPQTSITRVTFSPTSGFEPAYDRLVHLSPVSQLEPI